MKPSVPSNGLSRRTPPAQADLLPSWNDGAAKSSITDFAARATTQGVSISCGRRTHQNFRDAHHLDAYRVSEWPMTTKKMNGTGRRSNRSIVIGVFVLLALAGDASQVVQAQAYCAMYDDGTRNCGIPSLDSCRQ